MPPTFSPSPPHSRLARDHSPTKSSPLRHTISTRSNTSDTDHSSLPSRTGTLSSNASSHHTNATIYDDPFISKPSPIREERERERDPSTSPVKSKLAAFAKWEQREQEELNTSPTKSSFSSSPTRQSTILSSSSPIKTARMDTSPKKIRDDDWRNAIGRSEGRSVLRPVTQNSALVVEKPLTTTMNGTESLHKRSESKENIAYRPASQENLAYRPASQDNLSYRPASQDGNAYRPASQDGSAYRPSNQHGGRLSPSPQENNTQHRPSSQDGGRLSPLPKKSTHTRGLSVDTGLRPSSPEPLSSASPTGTSIATKNSLATLSRSDSMRASTRPRSRGHVRFTSTDTSSNMPQLDGEIDQLKKSSTPQLRELGRFAADKESTEELNVHSAEEQVTGLVGRRRLQRSGTIKPSEKKSNFASQFQSTKWMDTQRKHLAAYEYLCHIGEARAWIEDVLDPTKLPPIVQLEEALRDGVTLAEVVVRLAHKLPPDQQRALGSQRIFRSTPLSFRHSDNIALFFRFLAEIELPELFRFELIDLYEKKNIPKVIYCIHAVSWLLFRKGVVDFRIGNLVGQLEFADHELEETQKGIDRSGIQMPNFGGMRAAMQVEEEPPPPEPTPDELLAEQEHTLVELQTQMRGALVRIRLGETMQELWGAEEQIAHFQAIARGGFAREIFDFRFAMDNSTRQFQAACKSYLIRKQLHQKKRAWKENKADVIKVQSLWRGRKQRAETKKIKTQLRAQRHGLSELQSAIRGALGRWRAGDLWHEARDERSEAGVQAFQAAARGAVERMRVGAIMTQLWDVEDSIAEFQSHARGKRIRKRAVQQHTDTRQAAVEVVKLQAAARGLIHRIRQKAQHGERTVHEPSVVQVQGAARGLIERLRQARTQGALQGRESAIVKFQTLIRAQAVKSTHLDTKDSLNRHSETLDAFQALIRGQAARSLVADTREALKEHDAQICSLQSLARAMLHRRSIGENLVALEEAEEQLVALQSMARAYIARQRIFEQLVEMEKEEQSIIEVQSFVRAMLLRSQIGQDLGELEEHEDALVDFQAHLRGYVVRKRFAEKQKHFRENMQKVIKLQSFVRAKQQGESYKSLVNGKNPPLPVVRRHLHLLTDSNLEFEGELEAERLRRQVVESVRRNELVESYVEGLDVKIALLVKNKITLDEVVKHQKHFGGSASQLLRGSTMTNSSGLDLKALNKNSRKKLTGYEELFFMVQTQPQYLARLFGVLTSRGMGEKDGKNTERLIMTLFGYAQKSREEYMLLKVLVTSSQQIISHCQSVEDYMRQQNGTFQQRILVNHIRSPKERAYLKTLFGGMIKNGICAQDNLDLESDPLQIYRAILNNEELSTGMPSQRPRDLPREVVIRQEDVRPRYVEHLEDLRDLGDGFFHTLEETLHRMPYGLRFIAAEQHRALCAQFPREDPGHLAMIIGTWLWKAYLLPALKEPEMWGVVDRGLSPVHKRNLGQVITVLGQIASAGRLFGPENIYLQPLNNWITESLDRWQDCLQHLFDIPSPEDHYDADQFSDLYSKTKPTLYIKLADIFALHSLITENIAAIAPQRDDPIKELLTDLGSAKGNETDLNGATNGGEITLTLKSRFTVQEDPNAEARALFTNTKRLVLYIIRVQSGSNLMEILLRPITHDDADRWIALVAEELAEKPHRPTTSHKRTPSTFDARTNSLRGARTQSIYSEAPSSSDQHRDLLDLQSMTYAELKSTALENILQLENPAIAPQFRVSRHNNYQELLNALAGDIRQKHRKRLDRQRDVEATKQTLDQLDDKAAFLEDQLRSYNDYIEQCLHTLASKKGTKHKFILPFTKQWSHERELEKNGRRPQFGSWKYSARQLADKGVLVSWQGVPQEQWGSVDVVISSDVVGVFVLEASCGSLMMQGAQARLVLDELLQAQYDNAGTVGVFESGNTGGGARLGVNLLLHLIFKKFYRDD